MKTEKLKLTNLSIYFVLIALLALTILNCSNRDESIPDEYYVKYEVNSSTIYSGGTLNVSINDVNNKRTNFVINTRTPWEIIAGPFKKGFMADITVSEITNNYGRLTIQTKISVSKNNGPFAIKNNDDSTIPRTQTQLSYIIDF